VCPAAPGGHSISLSASDFHALDVNSGGGQAAAVAWVTPCTPLRLINGWTNANAPEGAAHAAVRIISGIVYFKDAVSQCSTSLDGASFARSVLA
jgi:hypothetical protein